MRGFVGSECRDSLKVSPLLVSEWRIWIERPGNSRRDGLKYKKWPSNFQMDLYTYNREREQFSVFLKWMRAMFSALQLEWMWFEEEDAMRNTDVEIRFPTALTMATGEGLGSRGLQGFGLRGKLRIIGSSSGFTQFVRSAVRLLHILILRAPQSSSALSFSLSCFFFFSLWGESFLLGK